MLHAVSLHTSAPHSVVGVPHTLLALMTGVLQRLVWSVLHSCGFTGSQMPNFFKLMSM